MGLKEWRQRQLDRADAMTERADERVVRAKKREAQVKAESEVAQADRAAAHEAAVADALHARARVIGEDHDDLMARATALGMDGPVFRQPRGLLSTVGHLIVAEGTPAGEGRVDEYQAWRDRIVVEESMIAKQARGESLSRRDRVSLKLARMSSR